MPGELREVVNIQIDDWSKNFHSLQADMNAALKCANPIYIVHIQIMSYWYIDVKEKAHKGHKNIFKILFQQQLRRPLEVVRCAVLFDLAEGGDTVQCPYSGLFHPE